MSARTKSGVAGRRRATSAQPARATSIFLLWCSSRHAPQPTSSGAALDTTGALLEGLRGFRLTARSPAGEGCWERHFAPKGRPFGFCRKETHMIANALILTIALLLALGFWLMDELKFLIPYRHILMQQYGAVIAAAASILFVNVFAAVYAAQRKFFLKDTGRKLTHVDNQATAGNSPVPSPERNQEQ